MLVLARMRSTWKRNDGVDTVISQVGTAISQVRSVWLKLGSSLQTIGLTDTRVQHARWRQLYRLRAK